MQGSVWIQLSEVDLEDIARILEIESSQVIAGDGNGAAMAPSCFRASQEKCMERSACRQAADQTGDLRDDLVPLEELWPPLDEPEEEGAPSPPETPGVPRVEAQFGVPEVPRAEARAGASEAPEAAQEQAADWPCSSADPQPPEQQGGHRAPLIAVVSGRGGVGKTTLVASMAACAARAGLRAAVLDLDLMFGDLPGVLGVEAFRGLETVAAHAHGGALMEEDIEAAAMRIGPGLTLWGPLEAGECAELHGTTVEQLLAVLRGAADVIFADTSVFWGDAVAVAVGACDRCLVVGTGGEPAGAAAKHVVQLAGRLGVPVTRMTSVFNRMGERGAGEEEAMRFEMATSLRSRFRIAAGGEEVAGMSSFGKLDALITEDSAFAKSVRMSTAEILGELGCSFDARLLDSPTAAEKDGPKLRLPWRRKAGAAR